MSSTRNALKRPGPRGVAGVLPALGLLALASACTLPQATSGLQAGPLQLGQAGRGCSFLSAIFVGPVTARGRNEGYVKTRSEIAWLLPVYSLDPRLVHGSLAHEGMTWPEYLDTEIRGSLNLNVFPDVGQTITACLDRGLVTPELAKRLRRHLAQCDFLNAEVLCTAVREGAVTRREGRTLFFSWLEIVGDHRKVNLYLHEGNRFMVRRLVEEGMLSREEAVYLLRAWTGAFERLDPSFLEDLRFFAAVPPALLEALAEREYCLFLLSLLSAGGDDLAGVSPGELKDRLAGSRRTIRLLAGDVTRDLRPGASFPEGFR
jgi:hypothetical protein